MTEIDIPPRPDWLKKRKPARDTWTRSHDSAIEFARLYDLSVDEIVDLMPAAYAQIMAFREMVDPARQTACRLTGLNSRRCNQWEDSGKDHSTRPGFDCAARTVVFEHPELGWNPDDTDTPARVWEMIKQGALAPLLHSGREVAQVAAGMIANRVDPSDDIVFVEWIEDTGDAFDDFGGDATFDPCDWTESPAMETDTDTPCEEIPDTVPGKATNGIETSRTDVLVRAPVDIHDARDRPRVHSVRRRARPLSMRRLRPVKAASRLADKSRSRDDDW